MSNPRPHVIEINLQSAQVEVMHAALEAQLKAQIKAREEAVSSFIGRLDTLQTTRISVAQHLTKQLDQESAESQPGYM